jgi:anti-sigma factor RsiW
MEKECEDLGPMLSAYLDGELPDEDREKVDKHLETCQVCRELVSEFEMTGSLVKDTLSREVPPEMDLTRVWEEIETQVFSRPPLWYRIKSVVRRPVVWLPAAVASAAAAALVFVLPMHREQAPMAISRVESVSSQTGQVMMLQTASTGQPLIWILPAPDKEASS